MDSIDRIGPMSAYHFKDTKITGGSLAQAKLILFIYKIIRYQILIFYCNNYKQ